MLSVWVVIVPSSMGFATHATDHRFFVEGYIRDSEGNGLPNIKVFVRADSVETGTTAFSDQTGFYSALLHLHDPDVGTSITVVALGMTKHITAAFDPDDKTTERKGVVDIVKAVPAGQSAGAGIESSNSMYLAWGLGALVVGVAFGVFTRKWALRRRAKSA